MRYEKITAGRFVNRPNRFVAQVLVQEEGVETEVLAHVRNTGRCRELLVPGAKVYLEDHRGRMGQRKLRYSLVAVEKEDPGRAAPRLINMDSQAPNRVALEALQKGELLLPGMGTLAEIKGEQVYGASRLDVYLRDEAGRQGYVEVKGVTLEEGGIARFPDAPTERGVKHLHTLQEAHKAGFHTYILFVIQMEDIRRFEPNDRTHPAFGEALREASAAGVCVLAHMCRVGPDTLRLGQAVPVAL